MPTSPMSAQHAQHSSPFEVDVETAKLEVVMDQLVDFCSDVKKQCLFRLHQSNAGSPVRIASNGWLLQRLQRGRR